MSQDEAVEAKPVDDSLKGIRGWLLFYLIGPTILGYTSGIIGLILSDAAPIALFVGIAGLLSVWSIFQKERSWVPGIHVLLNAVWGILALISGNWAGSVAAGLWIWYWIVSRRVKNTYSVQSAEALASTDKHDPSEQNN